MKKKMLRTPRPKEQQLWPDMPPKDSMIRERALQLAALPIPAYKRRIGERERASQASQDCFLSSSSKVRKLGSSETIAPQDLGHCTSDISFPGGGL